MGPGRNILHGSIFGTVWLLLAGLIVQAVTEGGTVRALGLDRAGLLIACAFLGGLVGAVYYALFLRDRSQRR